MQKNNILIGSPPRIYFVKNTQCLNDKIINLNVSIKVYYSTLIKK